MNPPIIPFTKQQYNKPNIGYTRGFSSSHDGIDYYMPVGTPLMAAQTGTVSSVGVDKYGGRWLHIRGDDGRGYLYVHIDRDNIGTNYGAIAKGGRRYPKRRVKQGDIVCYSGNTGKSTGPHLHWEIRKIASNSNSSINPVEVQVWSYKVGIGTNPDAPKPTPPPQTDPKDQKIIELEKKVTELNKTIKNQATKATEQTETINRLNTQVGTLKEQIKALEYADMEWEAEKKRLEEKIVEYEAKIKKQKEELAKLNEKLSKNSLLIRISSWLQKVVQKISRKQRG